MLRHNYIWISVIILIQLISYFYIFHIQTEYLKNLYQTKPTSSPDLQTNQSLSQCQIKEAEDILSNFRINITRTVYSYDEIENKYGKNMKIGGHWSPRDCQTSEFVALIICYRSREQHLKIFLNHIHEFLQLQKRNYRIFVINQHGKELFNRGALFNIGFTLSSESFPFNCFIFHDVDLLPEDRRHLYRCYSNPTHMSVSVDKFGYKLLYPSLFGGVTAFKKDDFMGSNGYPNIYWGWGNEDDDMFRRVTQRLKKNISRPPIEIARYQMIRTHGHQSSSLNPYRDHLLYSKYDFHLDGLNTMQYHLHQIILYPLFTLINVTLFEQSYDQIIQRLNLKKKITGKPL